MQECKANILGTEYTIQTRKISEDDTLKQKSLSGYCSEYGKFIVLSDFYDEDYYPRMTSEEREHARMETLKHEIIHAFFNESGLSASSLVLDGGWAKNEEMVDWIAIQSPKIFKVFKELELI